MGLLDAVKEYIGFRNHPVIPSSMRPVKPKASLDEAVRVHVHELQSRIQGLINAQYIIENVLGDLKVLLEPPYIGNVVTQQTDNSHRLYVWWRTGNEYDDISTICVNFNSQNLYSITFVVKSATESNALHNAHMVSRDMSFEDICKIKMPSWFKEIMEIVLSLHKKD